MCLKIITCTIHGNLSIERQRMKMNLYGGEAEDEFITSTLESFVQILSTSPWEMDREDMLFLVHSMCMSIIIFSVGFFYI